jgi:methionyl aminopeptidase
MIYKKSEAEIDIMRRAGEVVAATLERLEEALRPGVTTQELDGIAEAAIIAAGGRPSFKGYRGFPASICTSPNDVIVHGIPGPTRLEDGDIVALDVGVLLDGYHADSAWTFAVGEPDAATAELLKVTEASLEAAILACRPGARLGDVGWSVEQVVETAGFMVVREYVGHGVGRALHEDPPIPNYGPPGRREVLSAGMTLAIEPMVNAGGAATKLDDDGWTVRTADGSLSAHFEHTVAVTPEGHEILTAREPR